ncbi:MAG TPA: hypothetical protein VG325_13530 [Solirubrobacteraceae bacterium]|nr:hypothetical protein [Solirubrobacteraceae bacterium]
MSPVRIDADGYRLEVADDGLTATLASPAGEPWLMLRPLAALDAADGTDETLAVMPPRRVSADEVELRRRSTRWDEAWTRLVCGERGLEVSAGVEGRGALRTVRLLAVRSLLPGQAHGLLPSGSRLRTLFSPNPDHPDRIVRPLAESATLGVVGDAEPGRGRWLFTPAPLYVCLGEIGISIVAPVTEMRFSELEVEGGEGAFALALRYDGHMTVDGSFTAPSLVLTPGVEDPYRGLATHRALLAERGAAPPVAPRDQAAWWSEPIFCGWGAQCARARSSGRRAADFATAAEYDTYLERLEAEGVVPGTIVIDDKWQGGYGTNEPDERKWPDLPGWIAARHERGQHVLLWLKAWDVEGLPPDVCVRNGDGAPLAFDPTAPGAPDLVHAMLARLLAPDGLDADGLKIDFTARTPSGSALATHSGAWGIALLHELLALLHDAAKAAKPDALVVTHAPHPAFAAVSDMIRLNDMLRLDLDDPHAGTPVVAQMRHRAAVARAACPELLIDTDDWCAPSLAAWREYLAAKPGLGVPALYYADTIDATGERLEAADYAALRRTWAAWRARRCDAGHDPPDRAAP